MVGGARTAEGDWQLDLQNGRRPVSLPAHNTHMHTHARAHTHTHAYMHSHTHTHIHAHTNTLAIPLASTQPQLGHSAAVPQFMQPFWTQTLATPHPIPEISRGARGREQRPQGAGTGQAQSYSVNTPPPLRRLPFVSFYTTVNRGRASGVLSEPRSRPLTL